jgi:hypothetical protein
MTDMRALFNDDGWDRDACARLLREIEERQGPVGLGDPMDYWRNMATEFAEAVRQDLIRRIGQHVYGAVGL